MIYILRYTHVITAKETSQTNYIMDKDIKGFKAFLLSKGAYTSYKENLWQFNKLTMIELMGSLIYEDFFDIHNDFSSFRKELRRILKWWTRLTSDYEA